MSLERALKTLENLGLTKIDAKVYAFLEKKGPCEENELLIALNLATIQLRSSLKNLIEKEMIKRNTARLERYSAVPLERVLDEFLEKAAEELVDLQANKQALIEAWRSENVPNG